ncbi:600aa588-7025-45a6-a595-2b7f45b7f372 [Thermothielavioides terrestris]
MAKEP